MEGNNLLYIGLGFVGLLIISAIVYFGWFSPPDFRLVSVDKLNKSVKFKFGDAEHVFRSKQDQEQVYPHKNFSLKVKDVYAGGAFQNISFKLYRGDTYIKDVNPSMDYKMW